MTDDKNDDKGFKVEDRRTSSGGADDKSEEKDTAEEVKTEETPDDAGNDTAAEDTAEEQAEQISDEDQMPRVDFSTFIFSICVLTISPIDTRPTIPDSSQIGT